MDVMTAGDTAGVPAAFDFGKNWEDFSKHALSEGSVAEAREDFLRLMQGIPLQGVSFLDIGFGQGLNLLSAAEQGASAVGCDINPLCGEVLRHNERYFPSVPQDRIPLVIGSILDDQVLDRLRRESPRGNGAYQVVYSWGVLHHTGNLRKAVENACRLVDEHGYLVLAIYNRHWSSAAWAWIKRLYGKSPNAVRAAMIAILYPVIWLAKLAVTGKDPKREARGMDFYYDVIDWVGGYPYEYQSEQETRDMLARQGFACVKSIHAAVPTGCNQFVFVRT